MTDSLTKVEESSSDFAAEGKQPDELERKQRELQEKINAGWDKLIEDVGNFEPLPDDYEYIE